LTALVFAAVTSAADMKPAREAVSTLALPVFLNCKE
jgi:hypothetical protein